jgi:hypothetical protein
MMYKVNSAGLCLSMRIVNFKQRNISLTTRRISEINNLKNTNLVINLKKLTVIFQPIYF